MSKSKSLDAPEHIERVTVKGRKHKERISIIPAQIIDNTGEKTTSPDAIDAILKMHNELFISFNDQILLAKKYCTDFLTDTFKDQSVKYQPSVTTTRVIDGKEYKSCFTSFYHYLVAPISTGGGSYKHDSVEAMFAELLSHIKLMEYEEANIEKRLQHAALFGELRFKLFAIFIPQSKEQSKKAVKTRNSPKAKRIIETLQTRKASSDENYKELWRVFINQMGHDESDKDGYIVEEINGNSFNAKSWKAIIGYTNNKGEESTYPMTFGTFQNKFSV